MAHAIREITVARGIDPRDFALLAFGGAGPLHAVAIAEELQIGRSSSRPNPGVLSAWGMLQHRHQRTTSSSSFFAPLPALAPDALRRGRRASSPCGRASCCARTGWTTPPSSCVPSADLRYRGQEYARERAPGRSTTTRRPCLRRLPSAFADAPTSTRYGHNEPGRGGRVREPAPGGASGGRRACPRRGIENGRAAEPVARSRTLVRRRLARHAGLPPRRPRRRRRGSPARRS